MTLTKWNRTERNDQNGNSTRRNASLMDAPLRSFLGIPSLFNTTRSWDLMQDFFEDSFSENPGNIGRTLPAVNISENNNELVIEVAAPGMQKKDFNIETNNNQLIVRYKKEMKDEKKDVNHWRKEFGFESFERSFALPSTVESDQVNATYTDGILRIVVPKKEEARRKPAKTIEVK
jgi:HSP20 family protein